MGTAKTILLPSGPSPETSRTASTLLQENHEQHHMFFNSEGFHNHINHGLLTLWALGATPINLQKYYDLNKVFQRPQEASDKNLSLAIANDEEFLRHMGDDKNYKAFLEFFVKEIEETGWQAVVNKYLFAGDKRADSMLVRLFDSFLHPLIHLGFGIEFAQPAIIAEALAQTACHQDWIGQLLVPAEALSKTSKETKSAPELLDAVRADGKILAAPHWNDHDKIKDGIIARASDRMIHHLAQIRVQPNELRAKTAEMLNAAAYLTAGAQRPGKAVKFDFYLLHCLTAASFFPNFLEQTWLQDEHKAQLLEYKLRMDLVMYASRKSPELRIEAIRDYRSKQPQASWEEIRARVCQVLDDGHASKVVRAIEIGHRVCGPYQAGKAMRLREEDWHLLALMAIDSVEVEGGEEPEEIHFDGPGKAWVRSAGFDEAWVDVPAVGVMG